jgi:predicted metalloendopeptidase
MPPAPSARPARLAVPGPSLLIALAALIATPAAAAPPAACSDFDAYVNSAWNDATALPPDRARIGSFDVLRMANDRLLESALGELVTDPARQTTPGLKLLAAHYKAAMDLAAIDQQGHAAAAPWLARIDKLDRAQLPTLLGELARLRISAPMALFVGTDAKDVRRWTVQLVQGGLGLPDRDDYLKTDPESLRLQAGYRSYAARLLAAANAPAGEAQIAALIAFETQLARASATRLERRDPYANYHPQTLAGLGTLAPGFDWAAWLAAYSGRPANTLPLVLGQPAFAQGLARLAHEAPIETWQTYLRVRLLDALADRLGAALRQAHFDYYDRLQRGIQQPARRAEQFTRQAGGGFGNQPIAQVLGELYVSRAFSADAQQRANAMVEDIREAMRRRIRALPWMSETTRRFALAKLDAMVAQIGAPPKWPDYTGLELKADDYAGNHLRVAAWATARDVAQLGQPVDRLRWTTSPYIVNAFAAGGNRIVFPAGILQPPFFDPMADDATNYGAIGSVIGHEITHHFDDRGRQFDADGNLRDWWTPEDAAAYKQRAERLARWFAQYEPVPGVRINGHQMLGENISDLAGVQIAYDGLQIALGRARKEGHAARTIDGRTPEQRFFVANAIVWRSKMRVEALTQQLRTGQHAPGRYRVLGPLTNIPAFARAFGCQAGDAMVAAEPIVIW